MKVVNKTFEINTRKQDMVNIDSYVNKAINESNVKNGQVVVFCLHTTAAITINENADPDVIGDMLFAFDKVFPNLKEFKHFEKNSDAHIKSSVVGCQQTLILENKKLLLGMWQSIYFCEFDGPRRRKFVVNIIGE